MPGTRSMSAEDLRRHADGFVDFINASPTHYHAVRQLTADLTAAGFQRLSECRDWSTSIRQGGKYYVTRNGTSVVAFVVGGAYTLPGPIAMVATHVDNIKWTVKPISKQVSLGYELLKVAPYGVGGGAVPLTWFDRDLGLAGRVFVRSADGKVVSRLVRLPFALAKIPSLAEHFGAPADPPFDKETQMIPVMGLSNDPYFDGQDQCDTPQLLKPQQNHSTRLLKVLAQELNISADAIVDFDLELFDHQPATRLGLDGELLSVPRCDDKLCTYAAHSALRSLSTEWIAQSPQISMAATFDNEEIGSETRSGAASNFAKLVIQRILSALSPGYSPDDLFGATMAQSFLVSADVEHAVNPNFADAYGLKPRLSTGPVLCFDAQGNVTTTAFGSSLMQDIAARCGSTLQLSQIRNGQPSGGTIGPMLSTALGVRAVDLGIPQLAMHSIRATTGADDPGLGVCLYQGFFEHFASASRNLFEEEDESD
ncbi:peptidase M18 aminopeptidase I [Protomyces lactucae-debilis]|uniref:Peptidase M18 aminopeptidase I n=1 Tax=Protomyces lactucae-debilis TaxID=2754530 RepID=A0A1Y2ETD4_PROLT|nr:peptidase M18 aminopeptidase I [Protomyces lactucae-debilis]ORY74822.1 peptidase M18 aminopeptidase I [Protomyces lactucae-debilis]